MRDSSAMPRGDAVSVPSAAEVEHADWPTLQRMCESLGLNPKGRSGVVRMRVLDHVRRRTRPDSWRAGTSPSTHVVEDTHADDPASALRVQSEEIGRAHV